MTPEEAIAAVEKAYQPDCSCEDCQAIGVALPVLRALLIDAKLGAEMRELVAIDAAMPLDIYRYATESRVYLTWGADLAGSQHVRARTLDAAVSAALARARTP